MPSWGKVWLSILGVYEWEGVGPVPPELWYVPSHPQLSCLTLRGSSVELKMTG